MSKNNTGINNSGDWNSGDNNSGYRNSGDWNSGDDNSGYRNSGDWNSGDRNSGNGNSGDWNSGHRNSGDHNSGHRNSGIFNTNEPKMRAFNEETDMTMSEFINSDKYINFNIPLTEWISEKEMTEEEKVKNPTYKTTGGYLKQRKYKEAWAEWWRRNKSEEMKERIKNLPNFDADIFEEITGVSIDDEDDYIEIDGEKWSKSTIKEALKNKLK
jgi:hypothetical protein